MRTAAGLLTIVALAVSAAPAAAEPPGKGLITEGPYSCDGVETTITPLGRPQRLHRRPALRGGELLVHTDGRTGRHEDVRPPDGTVRRGHVHAGGARRSLRGRAPAGRALALPDDASAFRRPISAPSRRTHTRRPEPWSPPVQESPPRGTSGTPPRRCGPRHREARGCRRGSSCAPGSSVRADVPEAVPHPSRACGIPSSRCCRSQNNSPGGIRVVTGRSRAMGMLAQSALDEGNPGEPPGRPSLLVEPDPH